MDESLMYPINPVQVRKKSDKVLLLMSVLGLFLFCYGFLLVYSVPPFDYNRANLEQLSFSTSSYEGEYWYTEYGYIFLIFLADTALNSIVAYIIMRSLFQEIKIHAMRARWFTWSIYWLSTVSLFLYAVGSALIFQKLSSSQTVCAEALLVFDLLLPAVTILLCFFTIRMFMWTRQQPVSDRSYTLLVAMLVLVMMGIFVLVAGRTDAFNIPDKFALGFCGGF